VGEIQALREHWKNSSAGSIQLRELGPLLRDYQRLIIHHHVYAHFFIYQFLFALLSANR